MNFSFANPALLFGSLLFAVPLIIHLLNRRRYVTIRWAAQEFLKLAYQQTRRRLTFESWLLLLARCALIALLAFTLARPFVPSGSPLVSFTAAQRNVVIVVDVSTSMTRRGAAGDTALARARDQARALVDQLETDRGDRVGILTLSERPAQVLPETTRLDLARDALSRLETDWRSADLGRSLDLLDELFLAPATGPREVFVFSDMQRITFDPGGEGAPGENVAEALPAAAMRRVLARDARLTLVDVGDETPSRNLTVESLDPDPVNVVAGEVVTFTATVRNHSGAPQQGLTGTFVVDGRREQAKTSTFDVPARGVATTEFSTVLRDPGFATVEFELLEDELAADDRRFLAFPVREAIRVLIVDGHLDRGDELRASAKLERMIDPSTDPEDSVSTFRVSSVISDEHFNRGAGDPAEHDLVVLVDVPRLDEKVTRELEDAVRSGVGLLIFLGEATDAAAWNARLWREDGSGLLPGRIGGTRGDERADVAAAFYPRVDDLAHPIVKLFEAGPLRSSLRQPVLRFHRVDVSPRDVATTRILDLDDDPLSPSPLLLERPAGHGRVVLMTTTADASWARFAAEGNEIVWLPLVQEIASYLTLPDLSDFNLGVGDRLRRTVRALPSEVAVVLPSGDRVPLDPTFGAPENGRYQLPPFDRTVAAGFYGYELAFPLSSGAGASAGARETVRYAVNLDVRESDFEALDEDALRARYPGAAFDLLDRVEVRAEASPSAREGELWRPLLWILVALLAGEMALAAFFGSRSAGVGAAR